MATEKRLIDANALSEKIGNMKFEITHNRGGYRYCNEDEKSEWDKLDGFDSLVCEAPTVDAVEVVRCKECIELDRAERFDHLLSGVVRFYCPYANGYVPLNHFCSYGERRTDNA